eukprot:TRINITY_DN7493_c0_g2_i1.p1 TRINITY_DN7493_c0_g2~~TRINITY_DN7493_c0_g2_i1.p1  ORF type:complete len:578 (-),score=85.43 TRINITY_DN7493_c0_g2_i1:630-2279(-)
MSMQVIEIYKDSSELAKARWRLGKNVVIAALAFQGAGKDAQLNRSSTELWPTHKPRKPVGKSRSAAVLLGRAFTINRTLEIEQGAKPVTPRASKALTCFSCKKDEIVANFRHVLLGSKLNVLLIFLPLAIMVAAGGWNITVKFIFSLLALIPLAERLGDITEQLAMHTNDTLGGLLNATFGNATEVLISAFALQQGKLRVVQLSLLGSVLSNLLLVLGSSFLVGGIKFPEQSFRQSGVTVNNGLLLMAVASILLPSALTATKSGTGAQGSSSLFLSRFEAVFLLCCYCLFLVFQLRTHKHLFEDESKQSHSSDSRNLGKELKNLSSNSSKFKIAESASALHTEELRDVEEGPEQYDNEEIELLGNGSRDQEDDEDQEEDEEEEAVLSLTACIVWLTVVTGLIALLSEFVVDGIEEASQSIGIPMPFLSTIVLPIVGNAAEHASAIVFAFRNRMEITLGVAVGSATQISVLVVPLCVVIGWMMGRPLNLDFEVFETVTLLMSVLLVIVVMNDGSSNWLKGIILVIMYVFISAGFWVHRDVELEQETGTTA